MKLASGLPFRCFKAASAASRFIDDVVVLGPSHVALVLHGRSCVALLDRVPNLSAPEQLAVDLIRFDLPGQIGVQTELAAKANVLFKSFSAFVVSVSLDLSTNSRLSVVLRDGAVHVWQWESVKSRWIASASAKLLLSNEAVLEAAEPTLNGWICVESSPALVQSTEVVVSRKTSSGGGAVLVTLPGDHATVRLWLLKDPVVAAWVWSDYGGLACVNLNEPKPFCPPSFHQGLLEQHPSTRELVWLSLPDAKVWLLRPAAAPEPLCCLSGIALSNVKSMFLLYQMVGVLDEGGTRCCVFDLGSGSLLRSFAVADGFSAAKVSSFAPFVLLWSRLAGMSLLQAEPISQVQALLPPARGAKMAQDWGLSRVAAWRILSDCRDPVALASFTASPALSVALAGGAENPALVEVVNRYLNSDPGKRAFATLSTLTPVVDPLLQKWLTAAVPALEHDAVSEQEHWEVRALEDPEGTLDALLQHQGQQEGWRFLLTCRLLFRLRPGGLLAFVQNGSDVERRAQQCANGVLLGCAITPLSPEQSAAASAVLCKAGNQHAAARLLIANEIPQSIDFRLAFAEAMRRKDEETMEKLWRDSDLPSTVLLRMIHVYGQECPENVSIGLLKRMLESRK